MQASGHVKFDNDIMTSFLWVINVLKYTGCILREYQRRELDNCRSDVS